MKKSLHSLKAICAANLIVFSVFSVSAYSRIPDSLHLYQGKVYAAPPKGDIGSPTYRDLTVAVGSQVVYAGYSYEEIPLRFDLFQDVLATTHPVDGSMVELDGWLVDSFTIMGEEFTRIEQDSLGRPDGFYRIVYDSPPFVCYARHQKYMRDHSGRRERQRVYTEVVEYYISTPWHEGFQTIKNQRRLLRLHKPSRRVLRRTLFDLNLDFKNNGDAVIRHVLHVWEFGQQQQ